MRHVYNGRGEGGGDSKISREGEGERGLAGLTTVGKGYVHA